MVRAPSNPTGLCTDSNTASAKRPTRKKACHDGFSVIADSANCKQSFYSHRILAREGWPDMVFAFHDNEEIGPRMLARIAKASGMAPEDL